MLPEGYDPGIRLIAALLGIQWAMDEAMPAWAMQVAERELSVALPPRRWAHSQGVAARAAGLGPVLTGNAGLLVAAALLHDVGYALGWRRRDSTRSTGRGFSGTSTVLMSGWSDWWRTIRSRFWKPRSAG